MRWLLGKWAAASCEITYITYKALRIHGTIIGAASDTPASTFDQLTKLDNKGRILGINHTNTFLSKNDVLTPRSWVILWDVWALTLSRTMICTAIETTNIRQRLLCHIWVFSSSNLNRFCWLLVRLISARILQDNSPSYRKRIFIPSTISEMHFILYTVLRTLWDQLKINGPEWLSSNQTTRIPSEVKKYHRVTQNLNRMITKLASYVSGIGRASTVYFPPFDV